MATINGVDKNIDWEIPDHFKSNHGQRPFLVKSSKTSASIPVTMNEVHNYPFILINKIYKSIIHIDVDDEGSISDPLLPPAFDVVTYDEHNIPWPNYAVVSSGNKFHAFWLLLNPLPLGASHKSFMFFYDVRSKLNTVLKGDPLCNIAGAVRNPFYYGAESFAISNVQYALDDINLDVKIDRHSSSLAMYGDEYRVGTRNTTLFNVGLRFYKQHEGNLSIEDLEQEMMSFQRQFVDVAGLQKSEISGIARSIVCNNARYKSRATRNYGKMKMEPMDYDGLTEEDRVKIVKDRQSKGAYFTHANRVSSSIGSMTMAFKKIDASGKKPTQAEVAKYASLSIRTVATYWNSDEFRSCIGS